jgi:hypothetical protein
MKMKNLVALSALLAIGVVATAAHATTYRYVGALSGYPESPLSAVTGSPVSCFTIPNGSGILKNTCSTAQWWAIPLPIDTTGVSLQSHAYVNTPSLTNGTECRWIAPSPTNTGGSFTTFSAPTVASTWTTIGTSSYVLPPYEGYFFVECQLGPGAEMTSVVYFY